MCPDARLALKRVQERVEAPQRDIQPTQVEAIAAIAEQLRRLLDAHA